MATTVKPQKVRSPLTEACQRNISAELHFDSGQGDMVTARVRLLDMDGKLVFADRPQSMGKPVVLRPRQPVVVHFPLSGTRYAFRSHVVRSQCLVRLNANQRVIGLALALPAEVHRHQRRADFRLSLAGRAAVADVHPAGDDEGDSVAVEGEWLTCRLLNVSAGGVGLLVDAARTRKWGLGDKFFVSFRLPGVEPGFLMRAELTHYRRIHDGLSTVAGFEFQPWSVVPMKEQVREILRFIAAEQRRQLRRGR